MAEAVQEQKEVAQEAVVAPRGMVFTSDGSCNPNPGFGGWGAHGYLYDAKHTTKGLGLGSEIATNLGYAQKNKTKVLEKDEDPSALLKKWQSVSVAPVHYINMYGSMPGQSTNNAAEIIAMANVLEYAAKQDIQYLQTYTDSEYTINGLTKWMKSWISNNWIRRDGSPVPNGEHWKRLALAHGEIKEKGIQFKIDWVKGHNGDRANEMADRLALVGGSAARKGEECHEVVVSPVDGYWNSSAERHPFIAQRCAYFNTLLVAHTPGEYYMGNQDKDNDLAFKKAGDGAFSLVRLKTPEPMLEMIIQAQREINKGADSIFAAYLDKIFSPGVNKDLTQFGVRMLNATTGYKTDIWHVDGKTPITYEFKPPRLIMRSVEVFSEMAEKLDLFLAKSDQVFATDVTAEFFDVAEKTVKGKKGKPDVTTKTIKLKPTITVGLASINLQVKTPFSGEKTEELIVTIGTDVLARNGLKKLEDVNPSIHVITWTESERVYRYACVIQTDDAVGIWCGHYSNMRVV